MGDKQKKKTLKFFGKEYEYGLTDGGLKRSIEYSKHLSISPPRQDDKKDIYLYILFYLSSVLFMAIFFYAVLGSKTIGPFDLSDLSLVTGVSFFITNFIRELRYKIKMKLIVAVSLIMPLLIGYSMVRNITSL